VKTIDQLVQQAVKSQSVSELYSLFEQAIDLARFEASQAEFSKVREAKLRAQVDRQTKLIDNLEKTLWKK
jgi:hypothetical protein